MPTSKPAVSFRLTEETKDALGRLSARYGVSQAALVELLVRMLDQGHLTIAVGQTARAARVPSPSPVPPHAAP